MWKPWPKSTKNTMSKIVSAGKLVTPDQAEKIRVDAEWEGGIHGLVQISATIEFPKGAVDEDTYITMELDSETGVVTFMPHMIFNVNAIFTVNLS